MTEDTELCLLETYARDVFTGAGRIVDLGCWFGATTMSLARGLAANPRIKPGQHIDAIDLFEWQDWMAPIAQRRSLPGLYTEGQSFFAEVNGLLEPYRKWVHVLKQDLLDYKPPAEPVEFLFIDAMKSWNLANKIVTNFFPLLMPGKAYVVQQDFAFYHVIVATNHLVMWQLRDHFRRVHHVPGACSVVFFCTRPIDASQMTPISPKLFTPEMVEEAYDYSIPCVSRDMQIMVEAAKLNFLIEQGFAEPARRQMERLAGSWQRLQQPMLAEVRRVIEARRTANTVTTTAEAGDWLGEIDAWAREAMKIVA
jgi:hypothetical protein